MNKLSARQIINLRSILQLIDSLLLRLNTIKLDPKIIQDLQQLRTMVLSIVPVVQEANDQHQTVPCPFRRNLDYGERKQATIRGNGVRDCPYGLAIPDACNKVGAAIKNMTPIDGLKDEQKDKYTKGNRIVYAYCKEGKPCPYADRIIDSKFKVDCDFGDNGQGMSIHGLEGSPLYPSTFRSSQLDGLYNVPAGWYGDSSASRNLFFGLYSYVGRVENIDMVKISNDIGPCLKLAADKGNK